MYCNLLTSFNITFGASIASILYISYKNWKRNAIPSKWKLAGVLSEIYCFPIKSCGVIKLQEISCTNIGPKENFLRDRSFMVIDENTKKFVTARQHPMLVKITPEITDQSLKLSALDKNPIKIDMNHVLQQNNTLIGEIWDKAFVHVVDCGDDVSKWISQFILGKNEGLRLVYYPLNYPTRPVRPKNTVYPEMNKDHVGALHDATSFMLINEDSLKDLNSRLTDYQVKPVLFRSNFVMKGPKAYEEDTFRWVKIGNDIVFKVVKPCLRCVFTNVDPDTGKTRTDGEPLKTLKEYRKVPGLADPSPAFGIHFGLIRAGKVKIGDQIYVADE